AMNGYQGRILVADLSEGKLSSEPLNEKYARNFLGSTGLAARYLFDLVNDKTDPLGPDNPLILMPGLLNGTSGPSVSRWGGATKSPYTGHYGDANAGAWFGAELKNAGFDGIILKGRSAKPVYISIQDGQAEIRDAASLWGKDTFKTQEEIKKAFGDKRTQIACVGPAAENLVLFANIMSEYGHSLGRAGLGCVLGAKKVKAIAVRGRMKLPMQDPEKFREAAGQAMTEVKEGFLTQWMHEGGTASWVDSAIAYGDGPTNYYTTGTLPEATKISGAEQADKYQTEHTSCFGCPIRCRKILRIREGKYLYDRVEGPEYETLIAWGAMMGLDLDMSTAVYFNELCNRYGFDTISSGASAGYAYYLYNLGVISDRDTGGLKLTWGNIDAAHDLLHLIGKNQGFGAIVAEGTKRMARRYGRPAGEAVQTKGLEIPMHDPRAYHSMGLVYATAPRGADHNKSDGYQVDGGVGHPDLGLNAADRWGDEKAAMVEKSQNFRALTDSLGICHFAIIPFHMLNNMINAATGWNTNMGELLITGERIFQLQRALSCKLGITAKDDVLPELVMRPIPESGQEGHVPNMEKMLPEYYALRDWDPETGKPSRKRLEALGLADIAAAIRAK
ncbi:MAG TPA: aldehyde ferredoxin oxidoreductase family protein, partial [Candidatus Acidoferrum sp.]|nr:aldehyde ferredoxin oxidoreductase family protein [Candidatus Acidoferrum sp.]